MRRRPLFLAAVALPIALGAAAAFAPGCGGSGDDLDDICGWLRDPQGCYLQLHEETRTRCGEVFDPSIVEDPALMRDSQPKGSFLKRDTLDICVLENGGQVTFESAPALDQFPLTSLAAKRLDGRSEPCSTINVANTYNFSITFHPCSQVPTDDAPVCLDSIDGLTSVSGTGRDEETVIGGTFSITAAEDRPDVYLTTCPDGTQFQFNRFETVECKDESGDYSQLLPRAVIDSDPGGTVPPWVPTSTPQVANEEFETYVGWVRLRLVYPPYEGELGNATPEEIQYFNCRIPPQDPCDDGLKNFYETDIDCGGPLVGNVPENPPPGAKPVVRACPRCEDGMICESETDCAVGRCCKDAASGFFRCREDAGGGGGGGAGGGMDDCEPPGAGGAGGA